MPDGFQPNKPKQTIAPTAPAISMPEMSLRQFVRSRRYLLIAVISWIAMIILLFSVIIPQSQEIQYIQGRYSTEQKTLEQLRNKLQFLDAFDLEGFQQQNDRINTILPSSKPFLPLLHALKSLANEQGVIFSGLEWSIGLVASESAQPQSDQQVASARGGAQPEESLSKMELEMKILGTTDRLNSYFEAMTRMAPVIETDTVSLSPKFQIQEGVYEASLKLTAFYAPLISLRGVVTGDKPLPKLSNDENAYTQTLQNYRVYVEDQSSIEATSSGRVNPFAF